MKNIAVAGAGYVGLANAVMLARHHRVELVDVVPSKIELINRGISPLCDAEIESALATDSLQLHATLDAGLAYKDADAVFICTPTDYNEESHAFDTSSVEAAYRAIRMVNQACAIVIKSTVPIGYTAGLCKRMDDVHIVMSPEFLREGRALYDCLHPSRVIVGYGADDARGDAEEVASLLAGSATALTNPATLVVGSSEAEAIKLFSNTYLALRVSFFNELDTFASLRGLDTSAIIEGVCLDSRIGDFYNNPSFGYGGYCLPKDTKQLLANYQDVPQNLMQAIVDSNQTRIAYVAHAIAAMRPATVGVYRLAMKAGSDNFRQSSVLHVVRELVRCEVPVLIYEPLVGDSQFEGIEVVDSLDVLARRCDVIVANRVTDELRCIEVPVFTCDLFMRD